MNPDEMTPRRLVEALIPEDSVLGLSPTVRLENASTLAHFTGFNSKDADSSKKTAESSVTKTRQRSLAANMSLRQSGQSVYVSKSSSREMNSTVQNSRRSMSMTEGASQLKTPPSSSRRMSRSLNTKANTPPVQRSARQSGNQTQTLHSTPGNTTQDMSEFDNITQESYFLEYDTLRTSCVAAETTTTSRNRRRSSKRASLNMSKTKAAAKRVVLGGKVTHKRSVTGKYKKKKTVADKKLMFRQPKKAILDLMNHFCHLKVSSEAVDEVQLVLDKFWKNLLNDLDMYANHAKRKTIEPCDVELLLRRQRYITADESLDSLIHKYLPLEYQEQLCPIAVAGNTTYVRK